MDIIPEEESLGSYQVKWNGMLDAKMEIRREGLQQQSYFRSRG